jgi:hypothetical protein
MTPNGRTISLTNQATDDKLTMRFQKGNKFSKGGIRGNKGGRPSKEQQEIKKAAAEIAREFIETHVQKFLDSYLRLSTGKFIDPVTVRHAIDKILPDEQMEAAQPIQITFLRFGNNPPQLPAKEIPVTIEQPVPQENRLVERQELKFYDFAKRRDNEGQRSKTRT